MRFLIASSSPRKIPSKSVRNTTNLIEKLQMFETRTRKSRETKVKKYFIRALFFLVLWLLLRFLVEDEEEDGSGVYVEKKLAKSDGRMPRVVWHPVERNSRENGALETQLLVSLRNIVLYFVPLSVQFDQCWTN